MIHTLNGVTIEAQPPISSISVNKNSVAFRDMNNAKLIHLQNNADKNKFLSWLLTI